MKFNNVSDAGSSPLTRGARADGARRMFDSGIIPAYAGSTPSGSAADAVPEDHPRLRGEHSLFASLSRLAQGSSPLTRGAQSGRVDPSSRVRIIPAYAGSTYTSENTEFDTRDHPRLRGEHRLSQLIVMFGSGSSPLTRGALILVDLIEAAVGIIPAYAGSTAPPCRTAGTCRDHPRLRGEHDFLKRKRLSLRGSSPLTRGAPPSASPLPRGARDHPRLRGEHACACVRLRLLMGSSPLTRGARIPCSFQSLLCRIILAYAGSTQFLHNN